MKLKDIISTEKAKTIKPAKDISKLSTLKQQEIEYVLSLANKGGKE